MAVLIDEFDSIAGLVTLEDLVEEIVGEVRDEHDEDEQGAVDGGDGTWTLPGLMRTDEATEILDVAVPEDEAWETLGGLVTAQLERFPDVGDTVLVETDHVPGVDESTLRIEVVELDGRRVESVRVKVLDADDPDSLQRKPDPHADAEAEEQREAHEQRTAEDKRARDSEAAHASDEPETPKDGDRS